MLPYICSVGRVLHCIWFALRTLTTSYKHYIVFLYVFCVGVYSTYSPWDIAIFYYYSIGVRVHSWALCTLRLFSFLAFSDLLARLPATPNSTHFHAVVFAFGVSSLHHMPSGTVRSLLFYFIYRQTPKFVCARLRHFVAQAWWRFVSSYLPSSAMFPILENPTFVAPFAVAFILTHYSIYYYHAVLFVTITIVCSRDILIICNRCFILDIAIQRLPVCLPYYTPSPCLLI